MVAAVTTIDVVVILAPEQEERRNDKRYNKKKNRFWVLDSTWKSSVIYISNTFNSSQCEKDSFSQVLIGAIKDIRRREII